MGVFSIRLDEKEKILAVVRKHFFTFGGIFFRFLVFEAVLVSFYLFFPDNKWKLAIVLILSGIAFVFLVLKFIVWYLEVIIITNQRIINIDQQSLKKRIIVEALIKDIAEVAFIKEGIFQRIFNLGLLVVEIKGGGKIVGLYVKDPKRLATGIISLKNKNEQDESQLGEKSSQ